MPKVPAFFFRHAGVKLNSMALEFTRSGPAAATINAIAQGETRFGTTQGGTPTSLTFSRISQFHVWTAPPCKSFEHVGWSEVGCSHVSGLELRPSGRWPDGIRGSTSNQGLRASRAGNWTGLGRSRSDR